MGTPHESTWTNKPLSAIAPKPLPSSLPADPSTLAEYAVLKPKSCLACRKRKVKCDRELPCTNCSRWTVECIYPSPIRRCPRVQTKAADARPRGDQALHDRIHMLEAQVSELAETVSAQAERLRSLEAPENSIFPLSHTWAHSVAPLHPPLALGQTYWRIFQERVDPLMKVVHRPSVSRILRGAMDNPTSLNEGQGALLQVIYLACISAMDETNIQASLRMTKITATSTYRTAAEQALARAGFVTTNDWNTMQALVLFIALSRLQNNHKSAWALAGLAERLDISLEEDKSRFGAEMRRRLRWQMWYLSRRIQDDRGSNSSSPTTPATPPVGVGLPLNCHDSELSKSMTGPPTTQIGWTEMSFCLLRYDLATTERVVESDSARFIKTKAVRECQNRLHSEYLRHCDGSQPIHWLACHISYVFITEMWMKLYSPQFTPLESPGSSAHIIRDQLFDAAVDILDTQKRLEKEIAARKWEWTLNGYLQYVPLAFLLNELRWRQSDPRTDRAWGVAQRSFQRWSEETRRSARGVMLTELMSSVEAARQEVSDFQSIAESYLVPDEGVFEESFATTVYPDAIPSNMFQLGPSLDWGDYHT